MLLHPLLLTPPAEFVAARNALAKSLKAEGRRDDAAQVAAIRRPSWADWAVNSAARTQPDLATAFADAADAMRDAQTAAVEGRRADVAGALRALRGRTTELAKRANASLADAGRSPDIAELTERLAAVAADESATAQLRAAVLRSTTDGGDAIAGLPSTATAAPDAPATKASARTGGKRPTPAVHDGAERATERRRLMRELADIDRVRRTAGHELARAERVVDDADTKRTVAAAALARARADLTEADQRLAAATERRTSLDREVADAEHRAVALHAELDRLAVER